MFSYTYSGAICTVHRDTSIVRHLCVCQQNVSARQSRSVEVEAKVPALTVDTARTRTRRPSAAEHNWIFDTFTVSGAKSRPEVYGSDCGEQGGEGWEGGFRSRRCSSD